MYLEQVFISHSVKDVEIIKKIAENLSNHDIYPYIAERDLNPGIELSKKIMKQIDASDYFILVYSKNGKESEFVIQEVGYWLGKHKIYNLIPLVEKGVTPEGFLKDLEYIEFFPDTPEIGILNATNYLNRSIKNDRRKKVIKTGIFILGLVTLIILGIYMFNKERKMVKNESS